MAGPGTSRLRAAGDAGAAGAADGTGTRLPADGVTTAGAHVGSAADSAADAGDGRFGELGKLGNSPSLSIFAIRIIYPYWGMVISSIADVDAFRCPVLGRA